MSKYYTQSLLPNGTIGTQINLAVVLEDLEVLFRMVNDLHGQLCKLAEGLPIAESTEPSKQSEDKPLIITENI